MFPKPIKTFIDVFARLPSFGPRMATRLAFYLMGLDKGQRAQLSNALAGLNTLDRCPRCFFLKNEQETLCEICADRTRDPRVIAIVEKEMDIISLEKTGRFKGHFLVLGELPEKGMLETVHKLRLAHLKNRITAELNGKAEELVAALSPTTFGDFVTSIIRHEFKDLSEHITRLGRGIPTGGEIEFADEETLGSALERRV